MRFLRLRPRRLWSRLVVAGLLTGAAGIVVGVAGLVPASAAVLGACGISTTLVPGDSGSCSGIISDTTSPSYSGPVDVTLVIGTTSSSAGRASGSGTGTEALLDGQADGLQVTVTDTTTGQTFALGPISCYTDSTKTVLASYPNAAYCVSSSSSQIVATSVQNTTFSDNFVIDWSFPLAATNPYEGSGATITLVATFTGATAGGVLGASTGPAGGVLGASTPTTGAGLPGTLSSLLLVMGIAMVLAGVIVYRIDRNSAPGH
ncbi:MAG: hypothetical protein ABSF27_00835 [Candidatus Dormibacteria bacterium]